MIKLKTVIWDLDGTLIDSYPFIVKAMKEITNELNVDLKEQEILTKLKLESSKEFFEMLSEKSGKPIPYLKELNEERFEKYNLAIPLIKNAKETLETLKQNDVMLKIYTHKDKTTYDVIKELGIEDYFDEVLTIESGFDRKPSSHALDYLVKKHYLVKSDTYYVGDRLLDVNCANNAGVVSIFFNENDIKLDEADYNISDLNDVINIVLK